MNNNSFNYMTEQSQQTFQSKSNKKIILIIIAIIVFAGIGVFLFKFFENNNSADLNVIFDPNKPIVVKKNDKYGYITSEGKIMIEPQYKSAQNFYGDYAIVSIDNPDSSSYNDKIYQIIDKKGNVKLISKYYSGIEYCSDYNFWVVDDILYDSNLNRISSEGITVKYIDYEYFEYTDRDKKESGIMNSKGKKVFTVPGTLISVDISENEYDEDELYAVVKTYNDPQKEVIISLKTSDILFTAEDAESYYIREAKNGIFCYYNNELEDGYKNRKYLFFINNKLEYETTEVVDEVKVYDYQNQILKIDYGYDYEELGKSQRTYYYDVKNKTMYDQIPSNIPSSVDLKLDLIEHNYGFKKYSEDGKYGIMSSDKIVVPCEYDDIEYLDIDLFNYMKSKGKELVLLEKDKKLELYDIKNSKSITTFNSTYIYDFYDSTFIKTNLYEEDGSTIKGYTVYNLLSDKSMDFVTSDDNILIGSNYVSIKNDGKKVYYNTDFKQIYEVENS